MYPSFYLFDVDKELSTFSREGLAAFSLFFKSIWGTNPMIFVVRSIKCLINYSVTKMNNVQWTKVSIPFKMGILDRSTLTVSNNYNHKTNNNILNWSYSKYLPALFYYNWDTIMVLITFFFVYIIFINYYFSFSIEKYWNKAEFVFIWSQFTFFYGFTFSYL